MKKYSSPDLADMVSYTPRTKVKLLRTTLNLLLVILALAFVSQYLTSDDGFLSFSLLVTFGLVAFLQYWLTPDTSDVVIGIFLWGLLILTTYLAWTGLGLFNASLFAYPGIVMIAYVLGGRVLYLPIFIFIFSAIILLALAHHVGMIANRNINEVHIWIRSFNLFLILSFFSFAIFTFSSSLKVTIHKLLRQNQRLHKKIYDFSLLVNYDRLTSLPNENVGKRECKKLLSKIGETGQQLAFTTLDIHNLRTINNLFGYETGERLLQEFAERLSRLVSDDTYLYRFDGREFVFVKVSDTSYDIHSFKEQIIQAANLPFYIDGFEIELLMSVGTSVAPQDGDNLKELRRKSHLALYHADNISRNSSYFFDQQQQLAVEAKSQLLSELKTAIENQEFELFFQPKVDIPTGRIIGAEALVRWNRGELGYMMPNEFIPLAEESGLIVELTRWVVKKACQACKKWQVDFQPQFFISVNLSAINFRKGNLPQVLFRELECTKLSPHSLRLELSEALFLEESPHIREQLIKIHKHGLPLVIDDFGTGSSNFHTLQALNISAVKIDRSIINKISHSKHDFHIAKAIILMSKSLGFSNIAEGVEDIETLHLLQQLECNVAQGYFWCQPQNEHDFSLWLSQNEFS